MTTSKRIHWTKEERHAIARLSFDIRSEHMGIKDVACVLEAQKILLPVERHRPLTDFQVVAGWILPAWTLFNRQLREGTLEGLPLPLKVELPEPKIAALPSPASEGERERRSSEIKEENPTPPTATSTEEPYEGPTLIQQRAAFSVPPSPYAATRVQPVVDPQIEKEYDSASPRASKESESESGPKATGLEGASTASLVSELFTRMQQMLDPDLMRKQMVEIANQVIESRVPAMMLNQKKVMDAEVVESRPAPSHNPYGTKEPREATVFPKVLILGLTPAQENLMTESYPGINFYFMSGSEGHNRVEAMVKNMALTIKTQWIKGTMGSTHGWKNLVHSTGMDSIRGHLKTKFNMIPLR